MSRHVVAPVRELPPGSRKLVDVGGRAIVIFNIGGEFFALLNRCPHQGGNLCEGRLIGLVESSEPGAYRYSRQGEILRCPWHGWEYDLASGQSFVGRSEPHVRAYPVTVERGAALAELDERVPGPYVAETFPVRVEDEYVVLDA